MECCNAYESESMAELTGETLRPGGFRLTEKALRFCNITEANSVLDLGCGLGATVNYLYEFQVFIGEDLALGKMLEVEKGLEDK